VEITIGIRDADMDTLRHVAERQWRTPEQQASALLEQVLGAQLKRGSADEARARNSRRTTRTNGAVRAPVVTATDG